MAAAVVPEPVSKTVPSVYTAQSGSNISIQKIPNCRVDDWEENRGEDHEP